MKFSVTVEYKTGLGSVRRAFVPVNAVDCEGAEHVARNYTAEHLGELVSIISVVKLRD